MQTHTRKSTLRHRRRNSIHYNLYQLSYPINKNVSLALVERVDLASGSLFRMCLHCIEIIIPNCPDKCCGCEALSRWIFVFYKIILFYLAKCITYAHSLNPQLLNTIPEILWFILPFFFFVGWYATRTKTKFSLYSTRDTQQLNYLKFNSSKNATKMFSLYVFGRAARIRICMYVCMNSNMYLRAFVYVWWWWLRCSARSVVVVHGINVY